MEKQKEQTLLRLSLLPGLSILHKIGNLCPMQILLNGSKQKILRKLFTFTLQNKLLRYVKRFSKCTTMPETILAFCLITRNQNTYFMKLKIFVLAALLIATVSIHAQQSGIILRGGLNL